MPIQSSRNRMLRSQRLVRLTALICERQSLHLSDITDDLRITRRTAMRDLRCLREAGLHIVYFPREDRYRLVETEFL